MKLNKMQLKILAEGRLCLLGVAGARRHREAWILGEARIGQRQFAKNKDGTAVRRNPSRMSTGSAEAFGGCAQVLLLVPSIFHEN
jgi:hypothetical protein